MTFQKRAKLAMEMLEKQPPHTYKQMKAQMMRVQLSIKSKRKMAEKEVHKDVDKQSI
jgi:hypothetical protein